MPIENTDLERRVLAHEQILQALMAQLAEGQPRFLDRMHDRFASARRGAHEHDYVETADYAEAFLHEVARLVRVGAGAARHRTQSAPVQPSSAPFDPDAPVVIRSTHKGGVWRVTCDGEFFGDYLSEEPARDAANGAAREVERQGRRAELLFGAER